MTKDKARNHIHETDMISTQHIKMHKFHRYTSTPQPTCCMMVSVGGSSYPVSTYFKFSYFHHHKFVSGVYVMCIIYKNEWTRRRKSRHIGREQFLVSGKLHACSCGPRVKVHISFGQTRWIQYIQSFRQLLLMMMCMRLDRRCVECRVAWTRLRCDDQIATSPLLMHN